jgi:uncharacterized protein (DUF58 family)
LYSGDRVGLIAYGRGIRQQLPAAKGSAHLRQLIEQLALVREEGSEADHLQMAGRFLTTQKRRSLIVWLTDLAETAMTPEVIEAASMMMPRHLVLFVVIGQPDLGELAAKLRKANRKCIRWRPRRRWFTAANCCWRACASAERWRWKSVRAQFLRCW